MGLLRAVIVSSAWMLTGAYAADAPKNAPQSLEQDAALLVEALQLEPSLRLTLDAAVENAIKKGQANSAERECVGNMDLEFAKQAYVTAFTKALTREEMRQAIDFFESPAGREFNQYSLAEHLKGRGLSVPQAEMSDATADEVARFVGSSAGNKLMVQQIQDTPEIKAELTAKLLPELMKCKRVSGGQ